MNNDIFEIIKKWGRRELSDWSWKICSFVLNGFEEDVFRWKAFLIFFSKPIFCGQKNPFSVVLITGLCSFELKTSFWSLIRVRLRCSMKLTLENLFFIFY